MATAKHYRFVDCEALAISGELILIHGGVWPVVESESVSITIGTRVIEITPKIFANLKQRKKVHDPD